MEINNQTKKRRGGRPRSKRKQSYTGKFNSVNQKWIGKDWSKIKEVR